MREAFSLAIFTVVEIQVNNKIQQPEILVGNRIYYELMTQPINLPNSIDEFYQLTIPILSCSGLKDALQPILPLS